MLDALIPFELHLTVANLKNNRLTTFIEFCVLNHAKPILIELARGDFVHQPMLSKVVPVVGLNEALNAANGLSSQLQQHSFEVVRLKIEVPSDFALNFHSEPSEFTRYFEWHGKISYANIESLGQLASLHKAHLSLNALSGRNEMRFITLREYGAIEQFQKRTDALVVDLLTGGWQVNKQESEYCVYDNNIYLDRGWLPQ